MRKEKPFLTPNCSSKEKEKERREKEKKKKEKGRREEEENPDLETICVRNTCLEIFYVMFGTLV